MGNCFKLCFERFWGKHRYQRIDEVYPTSDVDHTSPKSDRLPPRRRKLRSKQESYSESVLELHTSSNPLGPSNMKTQKEWEDILPNMPHEFIQLYELNQLLGIGSTSKVFLIQDRIQKRSTLPQLTRASYACKVIDKRKLTLGIEYEEIKFLFKQLRKEVEILRHISHPHIVSFHDFLESKHLLFIITEFVQGGELFDYLVQHGALSESRAKPAFHGLFSAVSYLHERGVIHRDIKAENVMLYSHINGQLSMKLIDFGFSTILKHDLAGSFLGTRGYIAPEITQHKQYNMSVDNWALGVLVYCTLSAKMPFALHHNNNHRPSQQGNNNHNNQQYEADEEENSALETIYRLQFPKKQWQHISGNVKELITALLRIDVWSRSTAKEALNHSWVS
jgi:serine/threonine protein kinase